MGAQGRERHERFPVAGAAATAVYPHDGAIVASLLRFRLAQSSADLCLRGFPIFKMRSGLAVKRPPGGGDAAGARERQSQECSASNGLHGGSLSLVGAGSDGGTMVDVTQA